jgi:hypothetical protein
MADSSNAVANSAIQLIGDNQPAVAGNAPNFDNSPAGVALQKLYAPAVATVARQWAWDLARSTVLLTLTGNPGQGGFAYEYAYPPNGIEVWQIAPLLSSVDSNNPLPQIWSVGNSVVSGAQIKVIWSNLASAYATYNNNPSEATWDPLFREAVVRLLASELAMAIAGRPDTEAAMLQSGAAFESLGEGRSD